MFASLTIEVTVDSVICSYNVVF